MILPVAVAVGVVYAVALLLLLQGSLWRLLVGLALLSHGAHLLIFAGDERRAAPIPCPRRSCSRRS